MQKKSNKEYSMQQLPKYVQSMFLERHVALSTLSQHHSVFKKSALIVGNT